MKSTLGATARVDGGPSIPCQLEVEQEFTSYTSSSPRLNPNWKYRDGKGHEHYASGDELPTLFRWTEQVPCDGTCGNFDCDGYPITTLWCPLCGEGITPAYIPGPHTIAVPGPERWTVTLYPQNTPFPADEFDVLIDAGALYLHGRATVTEINGSVGGSYHQVRAVGVSELERTPA